jgi:hypothetical protein
MVEFIPGRKTPPFPEKSDGLCKSMDIAGRHVETF